MSRVKVEDKLAVNKYDVDREPHIKVSTDQCARCEPRPCLFVCPADCFKITSDKVTFSYEGCLECGSCRLLCERDAVEWSYPRPGFGICYEYG